MGTFLLFASIYRYILSLSLLCTVLYFATPPIYISSINQLINQSIMKVSALVLSSLVVGASGFTVAPSASTSTTSTQLYNQMDDEAIMSRRKMMVQGGGSLGLGLASILTNANNANAGLLDEFGTDPKSITQKKEEVVPEARVAAIEAKEGGNMEPNLRSNYYYPTNKVRYLPRIKKCNDAIPGAAVAIGDGDWEAVDIFVNKVADDTILPLKLYTSSLTGGGTNVKVSFTKDMAKAADDFEKAQKQLVKAAKKKDQTACSKALEDLSEGLQAYRVAGRITGPDAGGDIPSVDEIRRSACRVQGRTFEQKVKARDARLADAIAAQQ